MKKTGIVPLVFLLGFFCLSMNSLTGAAEKENTIEINGLIYSEKPTKPGTDPSTDPGAGSSTGPDTGSTAGSAIDPGENIGGGTSGTSGSSNTKSNLPQTNTVETSK